jgi:hypothetical protein
LGDLGQFHLLALGGSVLLAKGFNAPTVELLVASLMPSMLMISSSLTR